MNEARVLARVVATFTRAIRAMGYYDASHPVFEESKREAFSTLSTTWRDRTVVTLGSAGRQLVIDVDGNTLADVHAADVAQRMFNLSVVAIRIHDVVTSDDLGALMKVLAEGAEKIRAAGGARALLEARGVQGIDVLEVDLAALFTGQSSDLGPLVNGDPIAEIALRGVLRFKEDDASEALSINLENLATPESLGEFLDELLNRAEPGVVASDPQEWGSLSEDDLADFAAQAYVTNQESIAGDPTALAKSARVLSHALVRLAPGARFALLRKLAGKDTMESTPHEQAVARLGQQLGDGQITEAIASALVDRSSDSDTVRAIGNLIRRVRPVEAERRRLLADVDEDSISRKKPIDGVLWQQIQSQALSDPGFGLLEIDLEKRKQALTRAAQLRLRGQSPPVLGQDILHAFDQLSVSRRGARALATLLERPGRLAAGLVATAEATVAALVDQDDDPSVLEVLGAMVRRMDRDRDPYLRAVLNQLLVGERGAVWSARLLSQFFAGEIRSTRMMGELLLNALEGTGGREYQEVLIERLARFDHAALLDLGEQATSADPVRVHHLVRAALRADSKVGVKIARIALKNPSYKAKELALKALVEAPSSDALGVLAQVAGWKGDKHVLALLGVKSVETLRIHKLQLAAVGALGLSRSAVAVKPLFELLTQKKLFESKELEEIRLGAAQALLTNGTPEARRALEEGVRHKKRSVRDVCSRVLNRRGVL